MYIVQPKIHKIMFRQIKIHLKINLSFLIQKSRNIGDVIYGRSFDIKV